MTLGVTLDDVGVTLDDVGVTLDDVWVPGSRRGMIPDYRERVLRQGYYLITYSSTGSIGNG